MLRKGGQFFLHLPYRLCYLGYNPESDILELVVAIVISLIDDCC
jgi:hypothetical protein